MCLHSGAGGHDGASAVVLVATSSAAAEEAAVTVRAVGHAVVSVPSNEADRPALPHVLVLFVDRIAWLLRRPRRKRLGPELGVVSLLAKHGSGCGVRALGSRSARCCRRTG